MYKYIKKVLDIVFAGLLLIILLVPLIMISVVIILINHQGALFKQTRTGKNGKEFKIYKFSTMNSSGEYTKIGKFLKRMSLDELPQLLNILKGEMSFVGPRPWIPEYYFLMNNKQRKRVKVLPGITGIAQVKGRNDLTINEKIDYDLEYVNNCSFKMDASIILMTISTVFKKTGLSNDSNGIKKELEILKKENKRR